MKSWIFRGVPSYFDVDGYILENDKITWKVTSGAKKISVDDIVYIWRAAGQKNDPVGVVAVAKITQLPEPQADHPEARKYYKKGNPDEKIDRVFFACC